MQMRGALVEFRISRKELAKRDTLFMGAKGRSSLERFFVHNRKFGRMHECDFVDGPLLTNLRKFMRGGRSRLLEQQTAFHIRRAVDPLNAGIRR